LTSLLDASPFWLTCSSRRHTRAGRFLFSS
jgi:hypothetical protein